MSLQTGTLKVVLSTPPDIEPAGGVLVPVGRGPLIWLATHDHQTGLSTGRRSCSSGIAGRNHARGVATVLDIDGLRRIGWDLFHTVVRSID